MLTKWRTPMWEWNFTLVIGLFPVFKTWYLIMCNIYVAGIHQFCPVLDVFDCAGSVHFELSLHSTCEYL
jgi:hypothetical protein